MSRRGAASSRAFHFVLADPVHSLSAGDRDPVSARSSLFSRAAYSDAIRSRSCQERFTCPILRRPKTGAYWSVEAGHGRSIQGS